MNQENIDKIDGGAKQAFFKGEETAPGTEDSGYNEIGVGVGMAAVNSNSDIPNEDLYKAIQEVIVKQGGKKITNKKHLEAIANSARRESARANETIIEEGMNPETTTISHVWGSKTSLNNTVKTLKDAGVSEVNGIPIDEYEGIIMDGGAGENPTDTMIVMIDESQTPPKAIINHTSNKMSSNDPQANSTSKTSIRNYKEKLKGDIEAGKQLTFASDEIDRIGKERTKVVATQVEKMNRHLQDPKIAERAVEMLENGEPPFKKSPGKYTTGKGSINKVKAVKEYIAEQGWDSKNLSQEQKVKAMQVYVADLSKRQAAFDAETDPVEKEKINLSKRDETLLSRFYSQEKLLTGKDPEKPVFSTGAIVDLYHEEFNVMNTMRANLNAQEDGKGDRLFAEEFVQRLHLDVAEGHNPGGIPNKRFELNMGRNESGIRYDEDGNMYRKKSGSIYIQIDAKTGKEIKPTVTKKNTEVKDGDIATIANPEFIGQCMGLKQPIKKGDIGKNMNVGEITYKDGGKTGTAIVYDVNGNKVGYQTIRSKTGIAGAPADYMSFDKQFQQCLQRKSHNKAKGI